MLTKFGIKPWELSKLKLSEVIFFVDKLNEEISIKKKVPDWQDDIDAFYRNKKEINHA